MRGLLICSRQLVLMLIGPEYEDLEVWYPKLHLEKAGDEVKLAGLGEPEYRGKHGYPCKVDGAVRDFPASKLVGLIAPGGWAPDKIRRDPEALERVRARPSDKATRRSCGTTSLGRPSGSRPGAGDDEPRAVARATSWRIP
jgi:putative intracellular protease/amidase